MAGEVMTAYIAVLPSMHGFGKAAVQQIGPQAQQVGTKAGAVAGGAFVKEAAKGASSWLSDTARAAVKNVTLYGSMYAIITNVQQGIRSMFDSMVGFNAQLEQAEIGFRTLLGSQAAASEQMQWVKDFAKETPFEYGELVGYSQQLIALGFNAEMARDVLQSTGDAAAALGRGAESIARINLALGQMWTKGKVQSQEMLQLTEAGIGAWQILADAYGASVEQIQDAVTAGLVKASEAVPALLEGMNARFGGLMEEQSQTLNGIMSNIGDTMQQSLAAAGEPLFMELKDLAQEFLDSLDNPQVQANLDWLGGALADTVRILADGAKMAMQYRDALLMVGIAIASQKIIGGKLLPAGKSMWDSSMGALTARREAMAATQAAAAAETQYTTAVARSAAATQAANMAAIELAEAKAALTVAERNLTVATGNQAAWGKNAAGVDQQVTAAHTARAQAAQRLAAAESAVATANLEVALTSRQVAAASTAQAAATQAVAAAEAKRVKVLANLKPMLQGLGQIGGLFMAADGINRIRDAAAEGEQNVAGFGEAMAGGAIAGAAFGSAFGPLGTVIGGVSGAVIGLGASVWQYQEAINAANRDTSAAVEALREYGVEARLAELLLSDVTNEQLAAAGGIEAMRDAMRSGTFNDYVSGLQEQSDALKAQVAALEELKNAQIEAANEAWNSGALFEDADFQGLADEINALTKEFTALDDLLGILTGQADAFSTANEQIVASAYEAAFAADMQTGALGMTTKAAWDAAVAAGGLGGEALVAAVRMEGLAGVAGYATQMIAGIPAGTQINFSTNAYEVAQKIAALIAMRDAMDAGTGDNLGGRSNAISARIKDLQAQMNAALTGARTTLSLPSTTKAPKSGGAAKAASKAVDDAARKLEQDRRAQLRFADAFTAIMESALAGNFEAYRDKLTDEITSLTRDGYTAAANALKAQSQALTKAALDYSVLTNRLKAASDAYDDLTAAMRDQYAASRDQILGLGKATDAQSFDQLAYLLGETTNRANEYREILTDLKEMGLSDALWDQLAQSGPESMGLAQSILMQGEEGVAQLNLLSEGLIDAAESMGTLVSESMYQQGVDAMKAYIEGLKSESSALESQLETIANNVLNKTAGAITPGNAGYSLISAAPTQTVNTFGDITIDVSKLRDLETVEQFIQMLRSAPTTQLVNQAGTVTS